jgi:hypothetical protein
MNDELKWPTKPDAAAGRSDTCRPGARVSHSGYGRPPTLERIYVTVKTGKRV